ncbi:hypothetical protein [Ruminococcus flavefaciens]|uniref:hypothetical protein n=1 Tax=Ruminococcus flavefaciens TaxID=1265 RepID=UPI000374A8EC|nr:hypothetical protein [Ruminococcus flavefaciens]
MSKKYFIMNNRENTSEGYREVSKEFVKKYIKSFPEGERAYFINLGYAIMETNEESYRDYYKEVARIKYLEKLDAKNGLMSYTALNTDEFNGADIVVDTAEPLEDKSLRNQMIEKLPEALSVLSDAEKEYIELLYYKEMTERQAAEAIGIAQPPFHRRKNRILKKLSNFFEN